MKKKSAAKNEEQHRPPRPEPYPWLVYSTDKHNKRQIFCNISNPNETYIRKIPELQNRKLWANCHSWCLYCHRDSCLILWNPVTMEEIKLPKTIVNSKPISLVVRSMVLSQKMLYIYGS